MTSPRSAILVFVRAPEAGRVKTRLAAEIGAEAALRVYVRLAEHALAEARAAGAEVRVHFTPAEAEATVRGWLGSSAAYLPQGEGELGERLHRAFDQAFADGFERVLVIGSDLPGLSAGRLRRALELLEERGAVLGPAWDGGYYLLGLRAPVPGVFEGIPWSTERVLARTLERLRAAGVEPALLEPLRDVDRAADLPPGWREWTEG
ncbi:MAG TPA: TIGR04282 family arsenosugar biosynthesis glycosyltransferase [Longimicrobiaceae bacterium]|nr:TIGR04282 family arsenosugar biosynthesis glycosyltransferase [Longimicrobiaceae bacterium]